VSDRLLDLHGKSVLIVEDEFMIAMDYAIYLEALGAAVLGPVSNVVQALKMIRDTRIDAAILDIDLQGTKAFMVADALLEHHIHFIFATGYNDVVIPDRFAGIARCEKPASPVEIAGALLRTCTV
jgi:CheY-like chemotaxis protein